MDNECFSILALSLLSGVPGPGCPEPRDLPAGLHQLSKDHPAVSALGQLPAGHACESIVDAGKPGGYREVTKVPTVVRMTFLSLQQPAGVLLGPDTTLPTAKTRKHLRSATHPSQTRQEVDRRQETGGLK